MRASQNHAGKACMFATMEILEYFIGTKSRYDRAGTADNIKSRTVSNIYYCVNHA